MEEVSFFRFSGMLYLSIKYFGSASYPPDSRRSYLLSGIVHRFIPWRNPFSAESVTDHRGGMSCQFTRSMDEVGILLNQVFQHLRCTSLCERLAPSSIVKVVTVDSFRYFRVTAVDMFVGIERIGTGAFLQVDGSSFGNKP